MSISDKKVVKLVCITPENNNKFYIMTKLNNSEWEAQWGRIKGELKGDNPPGQRKVYPIKIWEKTYSEKTGKGYTDVTHLYEEILKDPSVGNNSSDPTSLILNSAVRKLMIDLQKFASISVKENYSVSVENVTQRMVDEAQLILDRVSGKIIKNGNVKDINNELLELYKIIPRKMAKVANHLVETLSADVNVEYVQKMIFNEQSTLDVMAGQVKLKAQQAPIVDASIGTKQMSLLEQMGLTIEHATGKDVDFVKTWAGDNAKRIKNIFKVTHKTSADKYDKHFKELPTSQEKLLWHGSRNQNWFNILQTSLLIRPAGAIHTGSMFGDACYFANKSQKAIGYTSCRGSYWTNGSSDTGFISLFRVNVGNQKHIYKHDSSCYTLNHSKISKEGFDSVYAHGGIDLRNDEFMIYKSEKCTIAYLIELM